MTKIVVLFNLKDDANVKEYENWARTTDLPTVNALASVNQFSVLKSSGLLGGGDAPYQYIEILDIASIESLMEDASSDTMQQVASEFNRFADNPLFITTDAL
ncbi:REDY-like protein HapK [Alteromonas sp. C1M14]|uniref:REDY-like protein HapK n=1 Tax=Alteromonas sp. C1M14 TaxID=2841567 RepID=UPI001C0998C6|nr:REDY-like protein HapK [Alteromonas sp. C1M14]MBU2980030.1 REDY-like protein HapK [Alteromonas sp. C1M14]